MTIYVGSRYANQSVVVLVAPNGQTYPAVFRAQPPLGTTTYLHYTVALGDRFDTLAYKYFADSTLWWMIADANPEVFYPDLLVPGSIIRIPQVSS